MLPIAILAGGLATRLRPISEKIPKSLIEIAGRPFIHWQLDLLREAGLSDVVLCTGFLGGMIEDEIGDGRAFGMRVRYSRDGDRLLGTGGALKKALPLLGSRFFILYGDSYLPIAYREVENAFFSSGSDGLMTVYHNENQWDASNVWFEGGRIRTYDKKNRIPEMHHIDYGLSVVSASTFFDWPDGEPFDLANLLADLVRKSRLAGLEIDQRFYEIGSVAGISELGQLLGNMPSTSN